MLAQNYAFSLIRAAYVVLKQLLHQLLTINNLSFRLSVGSILKLQNFPRRCKTLQFGG